MNRAEMRRIEREKSKKKVTYVMTEESIRAIRDEEYKRARKEILDKSDKLAEDILKMMIVIPTNVLINDYWKKTAKVRIPKFVDDCLKLYESWSSGNVDMEDMQKLTEDYSGIKLVDDGSEVDKTIKEKH